MISRAIIYGNPKSSRRVPTPSQCCAHAMKVLCGTPYCTSRHLAMPSSMTFDSIHGKTPTFQVVPSLQLINFMSRSIPWQMCFRLHLICLLFQASPSSDRKPTVMPGQSHLFERVLRLVATLAGITSVPSTPGGSRSAVAERRAVPFYSQAIAQMFPVCVAPAVASTENILDALVGA